MLDFDRFDLQLFAGSDDGDNGDNNGPDGGEGGGDGKGDNSGAGDGQAKTYDEAYVTKLRQEAAANRVKAKEAESKLANLPQETTAKILKALGLEPDPNKNYEQQLADANKKAQEAEAKANERLIKAEVKSIAVELKLVDADAAYALMDRTAVKINDAGEVEGVKEALEALTKAKPYLVGKGDTVGGVGSGSNPGAGDPPDPVAAAKKYAEERNKRPEAVQGGFDPWARK
jgi:hypothetical protein